MNSNSSTNNDQAMFAHLVSMLATAALQHMGSFSLEEGKEPEVNLEAAQLMIDMLDMLARRTQNNLTPEEGKLLTDSVSTLKLAYVNASKKQTTKKQPDSSAGKPAEESAEKTSETTEQPEDKPNDDDTEDKRKFHKSYG
ncbi:MAG: DUF1844 domain-containing protein [Lentisphaerae bacterium]|nr:DUF1844 domain-containing protein [Lentisphaerota bacterium]